MFNFQEQIFYIQQVESIIKTANGCRRVIVIPGIVHFISQKKLVRFTIISSLFHKHKGISGTLSDTYDEDFKENSSRLKVVNYFYKKFFVNYIYKKFLVNCFHKKFFVNNFHKKIFVNYFLKKFLVIYFQRKTLC